MSNVEIKIIIEKVDQQIGIMPKEQKNYILGFMEGVKQMSEKMLKEKESTVIQEG